MSFGQLILKNMKEQPRTYLTYFLGSVFSVTIFFVASLLYFHPALKEVPFEGNTRWTVVTVFVSTNRLFGGSLIVIGVLALLFLISMFRQFLKERRGNFSLYLILGMTKVKLWVMLFWENVIIGLSSLVTGISFGLVFSKLFLLLGQNIINLDFELKFYWPWESIRLTCIIYTLIFLLISVSNLLSLTKFHTRLTLNLEHHGLTEPKTNQYLVFFSPVLILFTYIFLFYLCKITYIYDINSLIPSDIKVSLSWSLLLVGLFCTGIYLFYNQTLIESLLYFRKNPKITGSHYLLGFSNMVYRLKDSTMLLFLTTLASFGALVIISSTLVLSEIELYGSDQSNSLAYTYRAYRIKDEQDYQFHQENIRHIVSTIEKAGYEVRRSEIDDEVTVGLQTEQFIPNFYDEELVISQEGRKLKGQQKLVYLLPLSEYNQMADFKGIPKLKVDNIQDIVLLVDNLGIQNYVYRGQVEFDSEETSSVLPVTFRIADATYNAGLNFRNVAVVSNEFYRKVTTAQKDREAELDLNGGLQTDENEDFLFMDANEIEMPFQVIHFREWAEAPLVDKNIRDFLLKRQDELAIESSTGQEAALEDDDYSFFNYSSSYQTLSIERQERGTTFLVSALIGSVFLIFTTCIIYFRLFGGLIRDSRYHHTLHLLGLTEKERGQLVTVEMFITFFLPLVVSALLYLGTVLIFQLVYDYQIWVIALMLVSFFILFQLIFFIFLRYFYLRKINWQIEKYRQN